MLQFINPGRPGAQGQKIRHEQLHCLVHAENLRTLPKNLMDRDTLALVGRLIQHEGAPSFLCADQAVLFQQFQRFLNRPLSHIIVQGKPVNGRQGGIVMADQKFEAILTLLVPQIVQLITENYLLDEVSAAKAFYESKVYALLEDEDTKVWHFSPATLFSMFDEEKKTGRFVIPEEG